MALTVDQLIDTERAESMLGGKLMTDEERQTLAQARMDARQTVNVRDHRVEALTPPERADYKHPEATISRKRLGGS